MLTTYSWELDEDHDALSSWLKVEWTEGHSFLILSRVTDTKFATTSTTEIRTIKWPYDHTPNLHEVKQWAEVILHIY